MSASEPRPAGGDPLRSFRGVVAVVLVLEGVVVLLALPLVAKLGSGLATWHGVLVGVLALVLFLACAVAGRRWTIGLAVGLQVVMIACWFAVPALGIVGVIFGLVWACLLWFRRQVAKHVAESTSSTSAQSTSAQSISD